jgi:hypothetical protein
MTTENKGNNIVTLTLTVPALEKLFEGDPQLVLELRKSAIANFAKMKIGCLLDAATKAEVAAEIAKQVGEYKSYPGKITVAPQLLTQIKQETLNWVAGFRAEMEFLIRDTVKELELVKATVGELVKQRVTLETAQLVKEQVAAKWRWNSEARQTGSQVSE